MWTLQECVNYAFRNNITIKQTELDGKTALIDKKEPGGPSVNANASHSWNIGLNQDYDRSIAKPNNSIYLT
jgi:outer membrane protein